MSDNELDNLFKEAAEGFKVPQDSSAWQDMASKLDQATPPTPSFWNWKTISSSVVVGIIGVAAVWYFATADVESSKQISSADTKTVDSRIVDKNAADLTAVEAKSVDQGLVDKTVEKSETDNKLIDKNAVEDNAADKSVADSNIADKTASDKHLANKKTVDMKVIDKATPDNKAVDNKAINKKSIDTASEDKRVADNKTDDRNVTANKLVYKDAGHKLAATSTQAKIFPMPGALAQTDLKSKSLQEPPVAASEQQNKTAQLIKKGEQAKEEKVMQTGNDNVTDKNTVVEVATPADQPKATEPSASRTSRPPGIEDSALRSDSLDNQKEPQATEVKDTTQTEDKIDKDKKEKARRTSSVSIKLALAPDFSSIKYFDADRPGLNYGLMVGYNFGNRWSLYTGAISSRKIYSSDKIDEPYTSSGGYDYDVTSLDGDCRVIDIPINVYYTFFPDRKFSIRAGVGISSYLMMSEDYVYHVKKNGPYGKNRYEQSVDHENDEWFKVMNISVMVQRRLSNRFYLEFEPFLKAPLAGVGEGEVSLVSLGAFLNLRFDIPIAKHD